MDSVPLSCGGAGGVAVWTGVMLAELILACKDTSVEAAGSFLVGYEEVGSFCAGNLDSGFKTARAGSEAAGAVV